MIRTKAVEVREIRIVFSLLSVLASLLALKKYPSLMSYAIITGAVLMIFFIVFLPQKLSPLFKVWMKMSLFIGKVNTQILLGLIFICIVTPIGLVTRLAGRDQLKRKRIDSITYWEQCRVEGLSDKNRYERQF